MMTQRQQDSSSTNLFAKRDCIKSIDLGHNLQPAGPAGPLRALVKAKFPLPLLETPAEQSSCANLPGAARQEQQPHVKLQQAA